jgi:DNA-binding SARP family transcriptional activator
VLRQYRRLRDLLRRELDVDPLPETEAAFRAALRDAEARSAEAVIRESIQVRVAKAAADGLPEARPS